MRCWLLHVGPGASSKELLYRFQSILGRNILRSLGGQHDRGSRINTIAHLRHIVLLSLPLGSGTHAPHILESDMHFVKRRVERFGFGLVRGCRFSPARVSEPFPDGTRRTGKGTVEHSTLVITGSIIHHGLWPRGTLETLWGIASSVQCGGTPAGPLREKGRARSGMRRHDLPIIGWCRS